MWGFTREAMERYTEIVNAIGIRAYTYKDGE